MQRGLAYLGRSVKRCAVQCLRHTAFFVKGVSERSSCANEKFMSQLAPAIKLRAHLVPRNAVSVAKSLALEISLCRSRCSSPSLTLAIVPVYWAAPSVAILALWRELLLALYWAISFYYLPRFSR